MASEPNALRVLMVLESHYPTVGGGGAEAQVRTLAKGLRARGHRVTIVTPLLPFGPQARIGRVDGVPVCRLPYPSLRFLGGPLLWLRLAVFLMRRHQRYDAWHVHIANHMGAVCGLLGTLLGTPMVVKVSGWWEFERGILAPNASPLARLSYRCLLRADAWQTISHRIAATLVEKGVPRERLVAVPNAVDTLRFRDIVPSPSPFLRFVFVGRLVPEKGLDTLIEAFADALGDRPDARLQIIGTGPLQGMLEARAATLGVAGRISFDGYRADIDTILAGADFAVLPSRIEGLSNTLLECMAAGLPMLASRVSGNEDMVRHGENGWLFEPGDLAALSDCLTQAAVLAPERRQAMGRQARETVERVANLDNVVERLVALYRGNVEAAPAALPAAGRSA